MPRRILHIVRRADDPHALAVAARQREAGEVVTVVLIQDAARAATNPPEQLRGSVIRAPGAGIEESGRLFDLIAAADSVVTW